MAGVEGGQGNYVVVFSVWSKEKKKKAWKIEKIGKKKSEPWYAQKEEALLLSHPLAKSKIEAYLMSRSRG